MTASLVRGQHRNFLVYQNYQAILDYNCSNSYAVSVGLLSDKIK
jgi:membrane-bound lytic murein transglycosylase B